MTDLELALRELDVDWPETPDIAAAVGARPARAPRRRWWRTRFAYLGAALVLLAGGTLAVPEARSTVFEWLGVKRVGIKREPPKGPPGPRPTLGDTLGLGKALPISRATHVPAALGPPDAVYDTTFSDGTT